MSKPDVGKSALEMVRNSLEEQGYTVILEPRGGTLPAELQQLRPDAIAFRDSEKVVITVKVGRESGNENVDDNTEVIVQANRAGWNHLTFFVNTPSTEQVPKQASRSQIVETIEEIERLSEGGHQSVALVACWATLEAIARASSPTLFAKPQTPRRIAEQLGMQGALTPDQADFLRSLIAQRNAFVHGALDIAPDQRSIARFIAILKSLAGRTPA